MYYLYWIRYPDHTDPKTQGYIGISSRPDDRFLEHKRGQKNKILPRVISKGASMEILLEGLSLEKALLEESKYRPEEKIGWNIARGGDIPPSKKGHKYKEGKQILKGSQRTDAQKLASLQQKCLAEVHGTKVCHKKKRTNLTKNAFTKVLNSIPKKKQRSILACLKEQYLSGCELIEIY